MDRKQRKKLTAAAVILAFGFFLLMLADHVPGLAEWYSKYVYRMLTFTVGRLFGIFPFSVAECCLYLVACWLLLTFLRAFFDGFQKNRLVKAC